MFIYILECKVTNNSFCLNEENVSTGIIPHSLSFFQVLQSVQEKILGGINSHQDKHPEKNVQVPDAIELTSDLTLQLKTLLSHLNSECC